MDDQVRAELDRPLHAGLANVLSTMTLTPRPCASAEAAARSVSRMTGFVGVSMNSIRVSGRIACSMSTSEDVST